MQFFPPARTEMGVRCALGLLGETGSRVRAIGFSQYRTKFMSI